MLSTLVLPLLFSLIAGVYVFQQYPARRPALLLNLILFQFVGAWAMHREPSLALQGLLTLHALGVCVLLVRHLQTPVAEGATASQQQ